MLSRAGRQLCRRVLQNSFDASSPGVRIVNFVDYSKEAFSNALNNPPILLQSLYAKHGYGLSDLRLFR